MYTCACPPPCETVSGMMIARIETSRRLQDNWIEQVEDHKIIREEVPRYKPPNHCLKCHLFERNSD